MIETRTFFFIYIFVYYEAYILIDEATVHIKKEDKQSYNLFFNSARVWQFKQEHHPRNIKSFAVLYSSISSVLQYVF